MQNSKGEARFQTFSASCCSSRPGCWRTAVLRRNFLGERRFSRLVSWKTRVLQTSTLENARSPHKFPGENGRRGSLKATKPSFWSNTGRCGAWEGSPPKPYPIDPPAPIQESQGMMTVADIFECVEHELLSKLYPKTVGFWPFTLSYGTSPFSPRSSLFIK